MSEVATSIGAAQEASLVANLPPSQKWWNPSTNQVEPLSTTPQWQEYGAKTQEQFDIARGRAEAEIRAQAARQRLIEREGYDRMGGTRDEFDPADFETAPSTPNRAGPGLAVSPSNVALGAAMGAGLVAGGVGLALASKESPLREKTVRPGSTGVTPTGVNPPLLPPDAQMPLPPVLSPTRPPTVVADFVPFLIPPVGVAMENIFTRRRRKPKSPFRKFL